MDGAPKRKRLKHEVPYWVRRDALHDAFFITVCCKKRYQNQLARDDSWQVMRESILHRHNEGIWFCSLFLAMPDHVHGIFRFEQNSNMTDAVKGWKRWVAQKSSIQWQDGFFDHRIRSEPSGIGKRNYIL